ncbi:helix-turn-helix domain-containing protein [Actinoplanes sp. NPDC051346]|uniref:ArsR/SmtB family transcription factor n=1 Tax=Actinoplanes sp. NPDC051346 TaxID=3155048 RepID=UPI003448578B
MIHIELDDATVARTRIAISPLAEAVYSLHLMGRFSSVPWPYTAWAGRARRILATNPIMDPLRLFLDAPMIIPNFLLPVPRTGLPTITEQLELVRDTPHELAEAQFAADFPNGAIPPDLLPFRTDLRGSLRRLTEGLAAYWEAAIEPYWPAMRTALDEEVLLRARELATNGPEGLLSELHPQISWNPPMLTLAKPLDHALTVRDRRLVLMPVIFAGGHVGCSSSDPELQSVDYQCRGAALLAEDSVKPSVSDDDRLGLLVGRGRASVLRALRTPTTTTGLARILGLAPSTVSEHLAALQAAGVAHRRRAGRRVFYALAPAGTALVTLLGDDSAGSESVS